MSDNLNNKSLFQWSEEKARDNAIAQVESNNDPSPIDRAMVDAEENLRKLPSIVSPDIILPDLSEYAFTDPRAMGPIMRRLVRLGFVESTGQYRKSTRVGCHKMPTAIYRNLLSREAGIGQT